MAQKLESQRGRKPKHWAVEAQLLIWHGLIKTRCGWKNHQLDIEFAWKSPEVQRASKDLPPRTFELIETRCRKPRRSPHRRSMDELVAAVAAHELFEKSEAKDIYESRIWELFTQERLTIDLIRARVGELADRYGLVRVWPPYTIPLERIINEHPFKMVVDRCVRFSLDEMPYHAKIEFVWYLYVASQTPHSWPIREVLSVILDELLDAFFQRYLPEPPFEYYRLAGESLARVQLDLSDSPVEVNKMAEAFSQTLTIPRFNEENICWEILTLTDSFSAV